MSASRMESIALCFVICIAARSLSSAEDPPAPAAAPQRDAHLSDELFAALPPAGDEYEAIPYTTEEADKMWADLVGRQERGERLTSEERIRLELGQRFTHRTRLRDPYPAILERLRRKKSLTDGQWRRLLLENRAFIMRRKWPSGVPVAISMTEPKWMPWLTKITATAIDPAYGELSVGRLASTWCGTCQDMGDQAAFYQEIGTFRAGVHRARYTVTVEVGSQSIFEDDPAIVAKGVLWKGELDLEFEVVESIDAAVPPIDSPALVAALRESMGFEVRDHWGLDSKSVGAVVLDIDVRNHPELARVALSMDVELLQDGVVLETVPLQASFADDLLNANSIHEGRAALYSSAVFDAYPVGVEQRKALVELFSLRVTGTSRDVLSLWHADTRWSGSFTIPLREAIDQEKKRTAGKERGPEISTPRWR